MLSKLFVLNIAELCCKPLKKSNLKNRKMKIVVRKEDVLKKVFKGVSLDSLAVGEKSMVTKMNYEEFYKLKYCSTVVYMVPRA